MPLKQFQLFCKGKKHSPESKHNKTNGKEGDGIKKTTSTEQTDQIK